MAKEANKKSCTEVQAFRMTEPKERKKREGTNGISNKVEDLKKGKKDMNGIFNKNSKKSIEDARLLLNPDQRLI